MTHSPASLVLSRRRMLAAMLASTAAAAVGAIPFAARAQEAGTPRPGGTLQMVAPFGSALQSLDPHATYESQDMAVSKAFHRSLYNWDSATNSVVLELASEVKVSDDGKTFTYKLLDNIYFHNGRQLVADDVIWSYSRILAPGSSLSAISNLQNIKGAQDYLDGKADTVTGLAKIDDLTFSITFDSFADPGFLLFEAVTAILPREAVESGTFLSNPVGCGPFTFVEHIEGSRISGKKFDKYFKAGKPYADAIEFTITDDYSALDVAFRAGEIDATVLSENGYVLYAQDPELSKGLIEIAEMFTRHMGMNLDMKPFDDVRVRQAINYAVDRDIIIEKLLKNKAFKAVGWLPTPSSGFDPDRKPYAFDPEKAKALLAEAGLTDGVSFEAWVTDATSSLGVLQAMTPFLAAVGITVTPKVVEAGVLVEAINKGEAPAWFRSNGTGPDPISALRSFDSRRPRSTNRAGFKDTAFDAILDEAMATLDPAKRVELVRKADAYIFDQAPVWFHNYNKAVLATQPWVHGVDANVTEAAIIEVDQVWLDENAPSR
ncbi:ABC transporter substrate-binding protein [Pseudogemmobacter blasticus]|uniref:ABC transporter substrate-binding protein n=1 Tax=Fuscovulum blasticum DSM 2131 TaxID=1188250 RepID=A0A2T4JBP9_FUSBL|nr:ABC transporter substrate-binding protein [Fuscovulum blasticum]PTE15336.1 ABC transporter substrate-binding protein [Fuscovulum blasticum DSM 2131]